MPAEALGELGGLVGGGRVEVGPGQAVGGELSEPRLARGDDLGAARERCRLMRGRFGMGTEGVVRPHNRPILLRRRRQGTFSMRARAAASRGGGGAASRRPRRWVGCDDPAQPGPAAAVTDPGARCATMRSRYQEKLAFGTRSSVG